MSAQRPKIVFFGTPALAVGPLRAVVESGAYEVLGAVTQTDKPAGRGNKLTPSPVKEYALGAGLPVFQPRTLKSIAGNAPLTGTEPNAELVAFLNANAPIDLFIVVAYGKIIPPALVHFPERGIINIHMSLLPRWRGAAPIQRAILNGDAVSGVSIMQIDEGLDTGPVYAVGKVPIGPTDDTGTLTEKLLAAGTPLLLDSLPGILSGALTPTPQPEDGATYAEKLEKSDFQIDWSKPASVISCVIRAASPHPGAAASLDGGLVKIFRASEAKNAGYPPAAPGTIVEVTKSSLVAAAGAGTFLSFEELQLPGKKRLPVVEFLKGKAVASGARFG